MPNDNKQENYLSCACMGQMHLGMIKNFPFCFLRFAFHFFLFVVFFLLFAFRFSRFAFFAKSAGTLGDRRGQMKKKRQQQNILIFIESVVL